MRELIRLYRAFKRRQSMSGKGRTLRLRFGKLDERRRKNLRYTADARRDDKQPRACRFEDPDPEGFRQGRVQEDLRAREDLRRSCPASKSAG